MKLPWYVRWLIVPVFCWPVMLLAEPQGTMTAQVGPNKLTLHLDPCPLGGWFKTWHRATWFWDGASYEACWTMEEGPRGEQLVQTVDSLGATGSVPLALFKMDVGI